MTWVITTRVGESTRLIEFYNTVLLVIISRKLKRASNLMGDNGSFKQEVIILYKCREVFKRLLDCIFYLHVYVHQVRDKIRKANARLYIIIGIRKLYC